VSKKTGSSNILINIISYKSKNLFLKFKSFLRKEQKKFKGNINIPPIQGSFINCKIKHL
jgi:hypothetical protein